MFCLCLLPAFVTIVDRSKVNTTWGSDLLLTLIVETLRNVSVQPSPPKPLYIERGVP